MNSKVYTTGMHTILSVAQKHISDRSPRKKRRGSYEIRGLTPSSEADACYVSVLMSRSSGMAWVHILHKRGGWEMDFPWSQTCGEPPGPSLPGFLSLPEMTPYTSPLF